MKTKTTGHTEGELGVHLTHPHKVISTSHGRACGRLIATASDGGGGVSERNANAAELVRRWNAEPELRKALENIADSLGHLKPSDSGTVTPAAVERCARAALAKGQP